MPRTISRRECSVCDTEKNEDDFYRGDWMCKDCKRERNRKAYHEKKAKDEIDEMRLLVNSLSSRVNALELHNEALKSDLRKIRRETKELQQTTETLSEEQQDETRGIAKEVAKKVVKKELQRR